MAHLTNTSRSATFLLGTAMLMLFFFCAPMHAQTPTFKSTSSYRIANPNYSAQQLDPTTIGHQTYHSTIYTPFGSSTPSSNNTPGGNNDSGSGTDDDDVGIPGWADTPSEPLPIGDTAPLFWLAAAMIAMIWIRQRKQQRLTTQTQSTNTSNNNDNSDSMHTTRHISSNRLQKLFLLLAFVCFMGQVSANTYYITPLFNYSRTAGNLPTNFPTADDNNKYRFAHQATYIDGAFYTNDGYYKIIKITNEGKVEEWFTYTKKETGDGTYLQFGVCSDDAGNLIINNSSDPNTGVKNFLVFPKGENGPNKEDVRRIKAPSSGSFSDARTNYISAKGNVLNGTGYIYFFPEGKNYVQIATIIDGTCTSIAKHENLSVTGGQDNGGYVIPIDGLTHYIYNERSTDYAGYYLYKPDDDKNHNKALLKVGYDVTEDTRNATYGGAYFALGSRNMFVHGSGANYAGGWTMRDLSSIDQKKIYTTEKLSGDIDGNAEYNYNESCAQFFTYERVNDYTVNLYEYCLGHGIAGWQIGASTIDLRYRVQTCTSNNEFKNGAEGGTVTIMDSKGKSLEINASNGSTWSYLTHDNDAEIICTATPNPGYVFIGWWNDVKGQFTENPWKRDVIDMNYSVTARFAKEEYVYAQTVNVKGLGTVTMNRFIDNNTSKDTTTTESATVNAWTGTTVTLTAKPSGGLDRDSKLIGWYEGSTKLDIVNPHLYASTTSKNITAYFACKKTLRMQLYDGNNWNDWSSTANGNTLTINYTDVFTGKEATYSFDKYPTQNISEWVYVKSEKYNWIHIDNVDANHPITFTADDSNNYTFVGWWNNDSGQFTANPWTIEQPTQHDQSITARFAQMYKQSINVSGAGSVTAVYDNAIKADVTETFSHNVAFNALINSTVKLTAAAAEGYEFDGWYENGERKSQNEIYTITPVTGNKMVTAKFKQKVHKLSVSVLNYNPEYDKFEEYGYEYNTVTLTQGGTKLKESYSSFEHTFNDETTVTLTATPEDGEDGYDFVGWYIDNEKLTKAGSNSLYILDSDDSKELTLNLSGAVAVNAHFAPKKCYKIELFNNLGGTYVVRYSKNQTFDQAVTKESSLDQSVYTYLPYGGVWMDVPITKPILGYEYKGYKIGGTFRDPDETVNYIHGANRFMAHFVRSEDQVVYLHLINYKGNIAKGWENATKENCTYYAFVENSFYYYSSPRRTQWIKMEPIGDYCYRCTIPGGLYDRVNFVQAKETAPDINGNEELYVGYDNNVNQHKRSGFVRIPATRHNCYRLGGIYSSTNVNGADAWTTPPTTTGDYRLIYIEQEVASKTEITRTYEFIDGDRIKKIASGTKLDTVSLHIYNKVSKDNNGNLTGTALNNPEIILQQWNGTAWVDVERHMVFGPLQTDNTGHIRMPGRKNTAPVVDLGIDAIKAEKSNASKDYGCGVWNFVIEQNGSSARLVINQTHRYEGTYYIRTPNADGQYNNFTHPGNILSYSEYAKNNSDYSHYFIRYVDIYEDGTPTAEAGKHPVVKFCIANDYAINLCKEFTNTQNRFEPEEDVYVLNAGDLPADATVRFGWDIKTNRLTRAYIANTFHKNNEYLVVEGDKIGSPSGDATYFTDNSNWLYSIDLNATTNAALKVKAKLNGQYQYFMGAQPGSQNEYETLISGNGASTYPIRLLYDFKDDRFTTIYRPKSGTINNDVTLSTPLMIEREHNGKATQIVLNTNKITTVEAGQDQFTQPAYAVMTFLESVLADASKTHHEKMFYWISFPFDVKISDVFGLGDYGKYWIMEEYDGAQRAQSGLAKSNWKYITKKSAVLSKNVGYVLCLNYSQILQDQLFKSYGSQDENLTGGKLSLYFPSNGVISPAAITGGQQRTVTLERYDNTTTGSNTAWNHHNWHIIGVPSFADPTLTDVQTDVPFLYQYWHPDDAYAAVAVGDESKLNFYAMHAYMVQYYGDITWTSVVNTGTNINSGAKSLAAKTDEEADKKIMLRLELQQAGSTIDKTYVQLRNDKGTKGFDMSLDLTKIINAGANIYSIVDNHEMAGNAIPKEETVLPLGVVITAAGEYTFAMPNGTEGMIVELIDYEQGTCTNLLVGDYTVNMPVGTNNTRFALRLKPDKVATSVEDITSGTNDNNVRKLLIDGVLYLQQGTNTYDAQGKHVQ